MLINTTWNGDFMKEEIDIELIELPTFNLNVILTDMQI
jgi:hypothetical protein